MPKWPFVSPCALACSEIQKLSYSADLILILQPSSPAPHGAPQFQMPQVSVPASPLLLHAFAPLYISLFWLKVFPILPKE